ncbi:MULTISPECIES: hypothetical protein [Actinoplanes]|nr:MULTISPECIES: hypothetical protein [Actinoplanes]GLY06995.1 hypothetical protein Acsp01_73740 [Actinoplanes sp. NBRC 101535]
MSEIPETTTPVLEEEPPVEELPQLIILEGADDAPVCENGVCW